MTPHAFGHTLHAVDGATKSNIPHRSLIEKPDVRALIVESLKEMISRHHVDHEALRRTQDAIRRLGLEAQLGRLRRYPVNQSTQKGNLAEIVLAEYLVAVSSASLPVYRLRYNPNVDQSMKGDDVLAFDLDASTPRVIVGEAKFRSTSSAEAVREIVEELVRSFKGGIPASLQFVADRLFEHGNGELGARVLKCAMLIAQGQLQVEYVGMLLSDGRVAERVADGTPGSLRRLAMISLGVEDPESLADECYRGLE